MQIISAWGSGYHSLNGRVALPQPQPCISVTQGGDIRQWSKHKHSLGQPHVYIPPFATLPRRYLLALADAISDIQSGESRGIHLPKALRLIPVQHSW